MVQKSFFLEIPPFLSSWILKSGCGHSLLVEMVKFFLRVLRYHKNIPKKEVDMRYFCMFFIRRNIPPRDTVHIQLFHVWKNWDGLVIVFNHKLWDWLWPFVFNLNSDIKTQMATQVEKESNKLTNLLAVVYLTTWLHLISMFDCSLYLSLKLQVIAKRYNMSG